MEQKKLQEYMEKNWGPFVGVQYAYGRPYLVLYQDQNHSTRAIYWDALPDELRTFTEPLH